MIHCHTIYGHLLSFCMDQIFYIMLPFSLMTTSNYTSEMIVVGMVVRVECVYWLLMIHRKALTCIMSAYQRASHSQKSTY